MAYRRPGVQVTQEFQDLLPALAPFNLPNCVVGPVFQVVPKDELGFYEGSASAYTYAGKAPGATVDVNEEDPEELSDHQYPITVRLIDVKTELISQRETGEIDSSRLFLSDDTPNAFSEVVAGDEVEILEVQVEIVPEKTDGSVSATDRSTLVGNSATEFAEAKIGDIVPITGGTDVTAGIFIIASKIDDQTIVLDSDFYTGGSSSNDVAYSISRDTGTNNKGLFTVREVTDVNTVKLTSTLIDDESPIVYKVLRKVDVIPLIRGTHYTADDTTVDLAAGIQLNGKNIIESMVEADYRALRIDLASSVKEYKSLADLQAEFGVSQIVPANPLAFGLSLALQNTVTEVNGLGLGAEYFTGETLVYQKALDVLKKTSMYALNPLSQAPVVHQLFATHVTQLAFPDKKKERVAIINRKIITEEIIVDSTLTDKFRIIVNTKTDGIVILGSDILSSPAPYYADVQPGDILTVVGGTGVALGDYKVEQKDSDTQLQLGDGFIASYNGSDIQYFIRRPDGIEASGSIFYDTNADFLGQGASPGHFIVIEEGQFSGRYKILSIDSNNQLTLLQIPGVVSVQSSIAYRIENDLTPTEIAEFLGGYASAFANRRIVMTFPDIVKIPAGSEIRELPGFYLGSAVVALTTGLPPQQGFTNLTVSGYLGFVHGSEFFDADQLDIIADGGVMVFDQEVPEAPLFILHELTTDRSSIKFQEYMVTKNVDFIAKFMRNSFKDYIGVYNITDATFDELKSTATAVIKFLQEETVVQRIGGVIRSGKLVRLQEGTNIDTIDMRFKLDIPIPLNNIDITVQV